MTDFKDKKNFNEEKSTLAVLLEIMKLLGLLCWKGIKKLGNLLLKLLKFLLKWTVKGIIWIIDSIDNLAGKIKRFWNNNDTQEKKRKILQSIKKGAIFILKGIGIALLFILKGLIWLLKKLFVGLIHIKSNAKTFALWISKVAKSFWKWICKKATACKNFFKKLKTNYKSFRRNQGFKGLLLDLRNSLNSNITQFIENEQDDDNDNDNDDETDIVIDTEIEEDDDNASGIKKVGRRIYKAMKNIVDID